MAHVPANPAHTARAIIAYLKASTPGRHADLLREELADILNDAPLDLPLVDDVLGLGDPRFIGQVLARGAGTLFEDRENILGTPTDVFHTIRFRNIRPEDRIASFDLLRPLSRLDPDKILTTLLPDLLACGDIAFFDHVLKGFPEIDPARLIATQTRVLRDFSPEMCPIFAHLIAPLDPRDPVLDTLAEIVIRRQMLYPTAVLVRKGVDLRPTLEEMPFSGNPWPARMKQRIASAHQALALRRAMPAPEAIAGMTQTELRHLLAGLSKKEQRALEKARKKAERDARHPKTEGHAPK